MSIELSKNFILVSNGILLLDAHVCSKPVYGIWPAIKVWKSLLLTCLKTQRKWELIKYMFSSQRTKVAVLFLDKNYHTYTYKDYPVLL